MLIAFSCHVVPGVSTIIMFSFWSKVTFHSINMEFYMNWDIVFKELKRVT